MKGVGERWSKRPYCTACIVCILPTGEPCAGIWSRFHNSSEQLHSPRLWDPTAANPPRRVRDACCASPRGQKRIAFDVPGFPAACRSAASMSPPGCWGVGSKIGCGFLLDGDSNKPFCRFGYFSISSSAPVPLLAVVHGSSMSITATGGAERAFKVRFKDPRAIHYFSQC